MKILLVNPSDRHQVMLPGAAQINFKQHEFAPPLALMCLKSYLAAHGFGDVAIFNFQTPERPSLEELAKRLEDYQPELVGISVMGVFWYDAIQAARVVKETLPAALVVTGGPHPTLYPRAVLGRPEVDLVVTGEGEKTLLELVQRLANKASLEGVPGLWWKRGAEPIAGPPRPVEPDLDSFPFPDRSDFAPRDYRISANHWSPSAVIVTSRGCPHACTFCFNQDHLYRTRRADLIADEVEACLRMGYRSVDFYDDNFNQSRKHVDALCRELARRSITVPWACRCRVDRVDDELLAKMAAAGCRRINFGVESATDRILKEIRKGITVEQVRKAFRLARNHGIEILGYFIVGFPGETRAEAQATVDLALELDPDYFMILPFLPVPGSPLYREALAAPAFGGDYALEYTLNPVPDLAPPMWETTMSSAEILGLVRQANLRFYLRPRFLLRALGQVSGIEDFLAKAWMGARLLLSH